MMCNRLDSGTRKKIGPMGRKRWWILVDECWQCGRVFAVMPLPYEQARWLLRYNRRVLATAAGSDSPSDAVVLPV